MVIHTFEIGGWRYEITKHLVRGLWKGEQNLTIWRDNVKGDIADHLIGHAPAAIAEVRAHIV